MTATLEGAAGLVTEFPFTSPVGTSTARARCTGEAGCDWPPPATRSCRAGPPGVRDNEAY
jgi:hypothetical protein